MPKCMMISDGHNKIEVISIMLIISYLFICLIFTVNDISLRCTQILVIRYIYIGNISSKIVLKLMEMDLGIDDNLLLYFDVVMVLWDRELHA